MCFFNFLSDYKSNIIRIVWYFVILYNCVASFNLKRLYCTKYLVSEITVQATTIIILLHTDEQTTKFVNSTKNAQKYWKLRTSVNTFLQILNHKDYYSVC